MAKKRAESSNLNIGDVVLLFYNAENKQPVDGKRKSGFIIADLSGVLSQQLLIVQPTEQGNSSLPSIQYGTFKVLAANKYEAQTRYRSLADKLNEVKRKKVNESATQLLQLQVTQAKRDSEVEKVENAARQARLKGSSVRYGDTVQLQHTLTGKYIGVSTTQTSVTESSKLKVSLQKKDSIGCLFRLHPHIKVQTVGEEVNYADQIKFESVATECQYLHCSTRTFGDVNINVYSDCLELNLAAKDSPLEIVEHYQPSAKPISHNHSKDSTLKSNGIIRFFHRKHHCYIVGEGSYASKEKKLLQTDDELLLAPVTTNIRKQSLTICSTLPRVSKRLSVSVSGEDDPADIFQGESTMRRISAASVLSQPSIAEVDEQGNPASDYGVIVEDVHFRKKRSSESLSLQPSNSPITFWQIVKCDNQSSGEPMKWSESCRIMHLPSRQYLAVEGSSPHYKVTLKSSNMAKLATVFELFPAVQQIVGEIDCESYVRIKHKKTKTWLHLNRDVKYRRTSMTNTADNLQEARELFQINATTEINSDDAFAIEKVEPELITDFNYVSSITTVLSKQLQQCLLLGGEPHSPLDCHMAPALSSLQHLQNIMCRSSVRRATKVIQKIIRSLKTLEIVVHLLNLHKDGTGYDQDVCTACFDVIISFLEGNSNKNKMYLSSMIDQIFTPTVWDTELIGGKTVEKALIGIAKDNPTLLYEAEFTKHVMEHLVGKLAVTSKNSNRAIELLKGLGVFCTYQGVPIKKNQLQILELFQQSHGSQYCVLYPLKIDQLTEDGNQTKNIGDVALPIEYDFKGNLQFKSSQRHPVEVEAEVEIELWIDVSRGTKDDHLFLMAQLHLLTVLCQGKNEEAIKAIQGLQGIQDFGVKLPFHTIMSALYDESIMKSEPRIRAKLLELLIVMFVDVGGNRPYLEKFPFSFKLNEIGSIPFESAFGQLDQGQLHITALTGIQNIHVPAIKSWINNFLDKKSKYLFAADENGRNEVVVRALQLLAMLLKFGFYSRAKDIENLLPVMFRLLNGKEDYPTREVKEIITSGNFTLQRINSWRRRSSRFTASRRSNRSTVVKRNIGEQQDEEYLTEPEEMDFNIANKLLTEFRDKGGRFVYKEDCHYHFEIKHRVLVVLNLLFNFQLFKSLHHFVHDYRWLSSEADQKSSSKGIELEDVSLKRPESLRSELTYLISNYPWDPSYNRRARGRARRVAAIAGYRMKCIVDKRGNPDLSNGNQLPEILLDLMQYQNNDLVQYSLLLLDRHFTSRSGILQKALQLQLLQNQDSVAVYNNVESLLVDVAAYLSSGENSSASSSPLEVLIKFCWLEDEAIGYEPHQINQKIILSFGILSDVLKYVVMQCSNILMGNDDSKEKVFECFDFLRALACKNEEVKIRLLQHMDTFLKVSHGDLGPHIGILLREIFSGSPTMCLALKESQVQKLVALVFAYGKENAVETNATMIDAMQCLLMVSDLNLPLNHCQKLVSRNFSMIREDDRYWCNILLRESSRPLRIKLLKSKDPTNPQLVNLLMITDLLATSAFGESSSAVSVCCTIFTEEELIEILSSPEIDIYCKRPFLKFFTWVYVNIQGPQKDGRYSSYRSNRMLWCCISSMADAILELSKTLKDLPMSTYLEVKKLLLDPLWKYLHKCPAGEPPQVQVEIDIAMAFVPPSQADIRRMTDSLAYLCDGILPFLNIFFTEFGQRSKLKEDQLTIAANIYSAMKELSPYLRGEKVYFSNELQVKLFYRSILVLQQFKHEGEGVLQIASDIFQEKLTTAARKLYIHRYSTEVELNFNFKKFVHNYQSAFDGKNTKRHQLFYARNKKSVSKTETYSEFTDEDMLKPGVKYLPLGRSFQDFVSLFKKKDKDNILGLTLGSGTLGNTWDFASRTINIFGTFSEAEDFVAKNPREGLIKQLEISLLRTKQGFHRDGIDSETQTELDIKCLQILRATIYNEIIQIDEDFKNEDPENFRKQCELYLHPVQTEIHSLGKQVSTYISLLSHPNEKIVNEVLAFLDVLLENADRSIQEGFNHSTRFQDQNVFPTLQSMLRRVSVLHNERHELIRMIKSRNSSDHRLVLKSFLADGIADGHKKSRKAKQVQQKSHVEEGGTVVISRRRQGPLLTSWFRRTNTTRVVLVGGNKRVPFLAIFQIAKTSARLSQEEFDLLQIGDVSRITLISKVLGLICDGQFKAMQNFLREQSESLQSINMVAELTSFLHQIHETRTLNFDTLRLFSQILQALIEMCTGNFKNCEVVFNANIMSVLNYVFQIDITEIKEAGQAANEITATVITNFNDLEDIAEGVNNNNNTTDATKVDYVELRKQGLQLKSSAVELLKIMLEKITSRTESLAHQIAGGLDVHALQWSMVDFFLLKDESGIVQQNMSEYASRALFMTYNVFMSLLDNNTTPLKSLEPTEKEPRRAWEYCVKQSRKIEIVYKDEETGEEVLSNVHFNLKLESEISEGVKESLKYQVDRTTYGDKIRDFQKWMIAVKKDTLYRDWMKKRHLNIIAWFSQKRYWLLLFLTLVLNVIVIASFRAPSPNTSEQDPSPNTSVQDPSRNSSIPTWPEFDSNIYQLLIYIIGGVHSFFSLWMVLEYFIVTGPHFVLPEFLYKIDIVPAKFSQFRLTAWMTRLRILPHFNRTYSSVNIIGPTTILVLVFLASSGLSLFFRGYFYCICLLYVLINNDILQRALRSITKNGKSLLWVAILLLIILFIYSVLSFALFQSDFEAADDFFCETLDQCFVSVLRHGLVDSFLGIVTTTFPQARGRFFFDVTFFIIVSTIGLNIVLGIIVDSYSELRDERYNAEQDMKSSCFICDLPSHHFEKLSSNGFDRHVKQDHSMWAYIYYSIYLDMIDTSNHNAIEQYVYKKISEGKTDYLPYNQALVLEGVEDEGEQLKKDIQKIVDEQYTKLILRFDALEEKYEAPASGRTPFNL